DKLHVGAKMIDLIVSATGLIQVVRNEESANTTMHLQATDALAEKLADWRDRSEVMHPERQPMVCPPLPWSTPTDGGYLSPRAKTRLVKGVKAHLIELAAAEMPAVYRSVNALQDTP